CRLSNTVRRPVGYRALAQSDLVHHVGIACAPPNISTVRRTLSGARAHALINTHDAGFDWVLNCFQAKVHVPVPLNESIAVVAFPTTRHRIPGSRQYQRVGQLWTAPGLPDLTVWTFPRLGRLKKIRFPSAGPPLSGWACGPQIVMKIRAVFRPCTRRSL